MQNYIINYYFKKFREITPTKISDGQTRTCSSSNFSRFVRIEVRFLRFEVGFQPEDWAFMVRFRRFEVQFWLKQIGFWSSKFEFSDFGKFGFEPTLTNIIPVELWVDLRLKWFEIWSGHFGKSEKINRFLHQKILLWKKKFKLSTSIWRFF